MTVTVCIDTEFQKKPGKHTNRWGNKIRSVRVWWLWFAVAWYRFSDYRLVTEPHEWSDG
jgi:hypothetical protein